MNVWEFCVLMIIVWILSACPGPDAAGTSASGSTGTPATGSSGDPSTGDGPEPPPTTGGPDTTGELSTGSTGAPGSTGAEPYCGDDEVNDGEECDYGRDNSETGPCTLKCKNAVCGDGFVWEGQEDCDDGVAGNNGQYGGCSEACEFSGFCGDGTVDAGFETCDLGPLNGTGIASGDKGPCSQTCTFQGRVVFLSSQAYTGDLGGLAGADLRCRSLAAAAGVAEATGFRAWLSDGFDSPATRFEQLTGDPYLLLDGRVVAATFTELIETGPRRGISVTETGETVFGALVWTNTSPFGDVFSPVNHCAGWISSSSMNSARCGYNALASEMGPAWDTWKSERHWTSDKSNDCSKERRLYCFQDGPGAGD